VFDSVEHCQINSVVIILINAIRRNVILNIICLIYDIFK